MKDDERDGIADCPHQFEFDMGKEGSKGKKESNARPPQKTSNLGGGSGGGGGCHRGGQD